VKGANHFFHESYDKLAVEVDRYLAKNMGNTRPRAPAGR
jgi:alpha/beta superfamily hydrolase